MPKHHTQVIPREVRQAIDEATKEILAILHSAGVDISAANNPANRAKFMATLAAEGIEIEKVLVGDRSQVSGTRVLKGGLVIGFVPAVGVIGGGKKIIV